MQIANANKLITVTSRHSPVTEAIHNYVVKKIQGLHLDFPRIIEAKAILDYQKHHERYKCEIVLFCANHVTIEADTETGDLYASIDETISKIARMMRKHKTRLQKHARPRMKQSIRHLPVSIFESDVLDQEAAEIEPVLIHPEPFKVKPLFPDEAIMELELGQKSFVVFHNQKSDRLSILYRKKNGDYAMVVPDDTQNVAAA